MLSHEFILLAQEDVSQELTYSIVYKTKVVRISDDNIWKYASSFLSGFIAHWDFVGNIHQGLNYHGITIIMPEEIPHFLDSVSKINSISVLEELSNICMKAIQMRQCIIHFGV